MLEVLSREVRLKMYQIELDRKLMFVHIIQPFINPAKGKILEIILEQSSKGVASQKRLDLCPAH